MVHIILVTNFFEPHNGGERHTCDAGLTICDWLSKWNPEFTEFDLPTVCVLNGEPVLRAEWEKTELSDNDILNFITVPGDPVTLIISAILTVVAIAVALSIQPPIAGQQPEPDPVFDLKGQRNQNRLSNPIEVPYGLTRMWPSYAALAYNSFKDNAQEQFQLFCLGQGEFTEPVIQIEDTPLENFQDIEKLVAGPNAPNNLFPDNVITSVEAAAIELLGSNEDNYDGPSGGFVANAAFTVTDKLALDISLTRGLYFSNDDGGLDNFTVTALFEYREIDDEGDATGAGTWLPLTNFSKTLATTTPQRFTVEITVPPARYEVRGQRTNDASDDHRVGDTLEWTAMRAFLPSTREYGAVTTLAIKARASNNLNDKSSNRINAIATRKLRTWDKVTQAWTDAQATRSPIWAMVDIFTSAYGGRLAENFLDLDYFADFAAELDAREVYFDYIFDQRTTIWEAAKLAMRVANSIPLLNGSLVTVIEDKSEQLASAVFAPDNMLPNSFKWDIKSDSQDEYDGIEIEYTDADTWKPETVPCLVGNDAGNRLEQMKLPGVTDRDRAYRIGLSIRAQQKEQREFISFETGLEGQVPSYGDLIYVSHDLFNDWSSSGFILSIDERVITLEKEVSFIDGKVHRIILRSKDGSSRGPFVVNKGEDSNQVVLIEDIDLNDYFFDSFNEAPIYHFGEQNMETKACKVTNLSPSEEENVFVECVNYSELPYTFSEAVAPPRNTSSLDATPDLPIVTGLEVLDFPNNLSLVTLSWQTALGAVNYAIQISSNGTDWENVNSVTSTSYILPVSSQYLHIRVAGVGADLGPWAEWEGNVGTATQVPNNVTGLVLQTAFTGTFAKIQWNALGTASSYRVRIYEPQADPTPDTLLRTVTVSTLTYTYSKEDSMSDNANSREFLFSVVGVNTIGVSDSPAELTTSNPVPAMLTGMSATLVETTATGGANGTGQRIYDVAWNLSPDVDISFYRVWGSATNNFTTVQANEIFNGLASGAQIAVDREAGGETNDLYWRVAAIDIWGNDFNATAQQTIPGVS